MYRAVASTEWQRLASGKDAGPQKEEPGWKMEAGKRILIVPKCLLQSNLPSNLGGSAINNNSNNSS